jgi:hypothetical protein
VRPPDIDDDAVSVERLSHERHVNDKGCSVQGLRRAKHRAPELVSDHDVIADFDGEQR